MTPWYSIHQCLFCCLVHRVIVTIFLNSKDLREPLVRRQGSQVSMRVARGSASWLSSHGRVLSSCDAYLLEPTEWSKGSQPSSSVWREDSGLLSRPCRKRRPTSRDWKPQHWVFAAVSASAGAAMRRPVAGPHAQGKRNPSKTVGVARGYQRANTLKP